MCDVLNNLLATAYIKKRIKFIDLISETYKIARE